MRTFLISAALLSSTILAAPVAAQYYPDNRGYDYNRGQNVDRQLDQIRQRIQIAVQRRLVSRNEANRLFREADQIDRLYDRYRRNGLTQWEAQDIRNRVQNLRQRVRWERREGRDDRRDDRWDDRNDRWDRGDRWDRDDDDDDGD